MGKFEARGLGTRFSKGPSQAGELQRLPHDEIPYRKGRLQVGKILAHVGLLPSASADELKAMVERAIATPMVGLAGAR
jgi:hypothetical protein